MLRKWRENLSKNWIVIVRFYRDAIYLWIVLIVNVWYLLKGDNVEICFRRECYIEWERRKIIEMNVIYLFFNI